MGQTQQATLDIIFEVSKLAQKTVWATHHSKSTLIILLWWPRTKMLGGPLGQTKLHKEDHANAELLQGKESNMSPISWHSSRLKRVARSSSAAETQAATDGDDAAVYICLCLKEVIFGQLD